jgi:hypothetical protein
MTLAAKGIVLKRDQSNFVLLNTVSSDDSLKVIFSSILL